MLDYIQEYAGLGWDGITGFVIPFIIVLSILVFVHEWGHYIVARMCGVRIDKFSIGFGPELFGYTDKSGTRWKLSVIPLGGYVQMFGDSDPASATSKDEVKGEDGKTKRPMTADERSVAFFTKSVWKRAAIVFAGPAINFIFAILLLIGLYTNVGKPVSAPVAAAVIVDGAADKAGIKPHDRILMIDGKSIESFSDIQRQVVISLDRPLEITLQRDDKELLLTVTPELQELEDRFGFSHSRGMIGIMGTGDAISIDGIQTINGRDITKLSKKAQQKRINAILDKNAIIGLPSSDDTIQEIRINATRDLNETDGQLNFSENIAKEIIIYKPVQALNAAVKETWFIITGTLEALGQIVTGTRSVTELGGIVRIGAIAGDAAQSGMIALITFTALLSINLGLINLFPIPLLDGGHLVFYAYEFIFGKPMSDKVMDYAFRFGMAFLVTLMIFANLNDIVQMIL